MTPWTVVHGILQVRRLEWVAFHFSRGSAQPRDGTQGLPHCRQILYQLSHKGSPRILEWVAYPFSRGSSIPSNPTGVFSNVGGFFTNCAIKEAIYDRLFSELCFHIAAWSSSNSIKYHSALIETLVCVSTLPSLWVYSMSYCACKYSVSVDCTNYAPWESLTLLNFRGHL